MTTIDQDYQFELDGYVFGLRRELATTKEGFDPGSADWRTQDTENALGDGRRFGTDYLNGPTWSWQLYTDREDAEQSLATIADFAKVWRNADHRRVVGDVRALNYQLAGRQRTVFGRPRRLAYPPSNQILTGLVPVAATFDCADALHYGPEETVRIDAVPASLGGFPVPSTTPWSSVASDNDRVHQIDVIGDEATYPVIKFHAGATAPYASPKVVIAGSEYGLDYAVPAGRTAIIDTRPWSLAVLLDSGASIAGELTRATRIDLATLAPGSHQVSLSGTDTSGTAYCTVSWRPAYTSL